MRKKQGSIISDPQDFINLYNQKSVGDNTVGNKAHTVALETRKFEIDLYWKRAQYFWTFVGATLTGYFLLRGNTNTDVQELSIVVASLGFVLSFAWLLVNRGSKYWQENWEEHVAMREYYATGPLFSVVLVPKGSVINPLSPYPFSVTKINNIVCIFVLVVWGILMVDYSDKTLSCSNVAKDWLFSVCVIFIVLASISLLWYGRSSFVNSLHSSSSKDNTDFFYTEYEGINPQKESQ